MDPPPPESMGDFLTGRVAVTGMISLLAAQEAEKGAQARVWENNAIRAVLGGAAPRYGRSFADAASTPDASHTISALDAMNAELRQALIALHEAVEAADDKALHHEILWLYREMAEARRLDLPTA
jgi:hypothetical protein